MKKSKNDFLKYFIILLTVFLLIFIFSIVNNPSKTNFEVKDFQSCADAGYPVMESYPRQCAKDNVIYVEKINEECFVDSDCETPAYYLIQSNCPYTSICIKNTCNVVCPISLENKTNDFWNVSCKTDVDCNCTRVSKDLKNCSCINNQCYAVMRNLEN